LEPLLESAFKLDHNVDFSTTDMTSLEQIALAKTPEQ
jgi:hypothetical protein